MKLRPKFTLERSALVAEIVSGVAVAMTLLFLALGIRDSTAVTRAVAYGDLLDRINQFNLAVVDDESLAPIWTAFRTGQADQLGDDEMTRLVLLTRVLYRTYESAYVSREYGILGPSEWERFGTTICNTYRNMTPALWANVRSILSADFVAYIEGGCSEGR